MEDGNRQVLRPPNAILIDLDDTLIDDGGGVESSWLKACREAQKSLDPVTPEELLAAIHRQREWFWSDPERHRTGRADLRAASRNIMHLALQELGVDRLDLARDIAERYRDLRDEGLTLFPDALDTLEQLKSQNLKLALITNGSGPAQLSKIERFELARFFDHVQIEGDFGFGKPDERVYKNALDKLETPSMEAWSVGDNLEWDVLAPKRLGMQGIWVNPGGQNDLRRRLASKVLQRDTDEKPDRIIGTFGELPDLISESLRG